jgi:hypothetical protein
MQNSYIERFNRPYRDEVLDLYLFLSLCEERDMTSKLDDEMQRGKAILCPAGPGACRVPDGQNAAKNSRNLRA